MVWFSITSPLYGAGIELVEAFPPESLRPFEVV
jgi:hypothetical protein